MESLRERTIRGISWSVVESSLVQGVRFLMGIVLARVLYPEQFGLIGMLSIFMGVAQAILDSGFGAALIQKQETKHTDYCTIFYFQNGIGFILYGCLFLSAPLIAFFYKQPSLTALTRVLSLCIVINSFGWIHSTILTKSINFKTQAIVNVSAGVFSGVCGITLAKLGFGVWSLVSWHVLNSLSRTVLYWIVCSWRPTLSFCRASLGSMFKFGSRIFLSGMLNQIYDNIYYLVIGKLFTVRDLGFFTRAKTIADLPSISISQMIGRVAFPAFSTIQDSQEKLKYALKKMLTTVALLSFPTMICMSVAARNLIYALMTEKWAASVTYFRLLLIAGILFPIHVVSMDAIRALGRSEIYLRIEIIKKVLVTINIAIGFIWGLSPMIFGMIVVSMIYYFLSSYQLKKLICYSMAEQSRDIFPYLVLSAIMAISVYAVDMVLIDNHWVKLLLQIMVGFLLWIALSLLFRLAAFQVVKELAAEVVKRIRLSRN